MVDCDCDFINSVGDLLMAAAREGDFDALQRCLQAVPNPEDYINRLYHGEHPIKRTLLTIACTHGREDFVRQFLLHHKPNLEVSSVADLEDAPPPKRIKCFGASALWVAAAVNNLEIVKLLVEHGAQVNHVTATNSTALRCACWDGNMDMIRYLVGKGGDIHIAREHNHTNLLVGVFRKHLNVVTYLVDEAGFDVNECDAEGRSPLYEVVNSCSLEISQFLLDRGARNFPSTHDQMSPLMWAAEKLQTDIFNAILPHCSVLEQIEGEELFGSALVCDQSKEGDLERAFEHFCRALDLRANHDLPKTPKPTTIEIFVNRQECGTIDALQAIRSNTDEMWIEAILVRERLLGPTNEEYLDSIRYYGAVLADKDEYDRAVTLWLYDLQMRRQHAISVDRYKLRSFAAVFSHRIVFMSFPSIDTLETVIEITLESLDNHSEDFDYHFHTLLFLITIANQILAQPGISPTDRRKIQGQFHRINQCKWVTKVDRSSLLHLSLSDRTSADDHHIGRLCKYPCLSTARLLLNCGADIDAMDAVRNTPLHVLVGNSSEPDEALVNLLCDRGAHLDCVNALGETAFDIATSLKIKALIRARMKISLKCLCARLIRKSEVPFNGRVNKSLEKFVAEH